jgi:excisionase family DNA binding protein
MAEVIAPKYANLQTAAPWSGLSEKTLRRLIGEGKLTSYSPVGDRILINLHELDDLIRGGRVKPRDVRKQ